MTRTFGKPNEEIKTTTDVFIILQSFKQNCKQNEKQN